MTTEKAPPGVENPEVVRYIGIVGHAAEKFTPATEHAARQLIHDLLVLHPEACVVSGRSPMGGVDIWAEECAHLLGRRAIIHPPKRRSWDGGFKPRNLLIVRDSAEVHVIVVRTYPDGFNGMRFPGCYHCLAKRPPHVKSGGCWTGIQALRIGKPAHWHILDP